MDFPHVEICATAFSADRLALRFFSTTLSLFVLTAIWLVPWPMRLLPSLGNVLKPLFAPPMEAVLNLWPSFAGTAARFYSDSISLYLLVFAALGFSALLAALSATSNPLRSFAAGCSDVAKLSALFFLVLHLLSYGLDKCFVTQFYTPEPNTLYSTFGQLDRDLLYWSVMGLSPAFSMVLGMTEVVAALLLLIPRLRTLGLILSVAILSHVFAVNMAFDISVKLLSAFLLLLSLWLLQPQAKPIFQFFTQQTLRKPLPAFNWRFTRRTTVDTMLKIFLLLVILAEGFGPHLLARLRSSDAAKLPQGLSAAYEVTGQSASGHPTIEQFFFHREGYFILRYSDQSMQSNLILFHPLEQSFYVIEPIENKGRWAYEIAPDGESITLHHETESGYSTLVGAPLNWQNLPALREDFHWTIEQVTGE